MKNKSALILVSLSALLSFSSCKENKGNHHKLKQFDVSLCGCSFTYDGNEHSLKLVGDIPEGTDIVWENNALTQPGEQDVYVTLSKEGYETLVLSGSLVISYAQLPTSLEISPKTLTVDPGQDFTFNIVGLETLPSDAVVTFAYACEDDGVVYYEKPNFGGTFSVVAEISAFGYETVNLFASLIVNHPAATDISFIKLPKISHPDYLDKNCLLKGQSFKPSFNILPKGHAEDELILESDDEDVLKIENGKIVASGYGSATITASYGNASVSQIVVVPDINYAFEDFESDNPQVTNGFCLFEVIESDGNKLGRVSSPASPSDFYSVIKFKLDLSKGYSPGVYIFEADVQEIEPYAFVIQYFLDDMELPISPTSGARGDHTAILDENGHIKIQFPITSEMIGDGDISIALAQFNKTPIDYTIDNVSLIQIA